MVNSAMIPPFDATGLLARWTRLLEPETRVNRPRQAGCRGCQIAARRARGQSVSIILQSTVGGFSPEFMRELPQLEQAMIAHGLEPSQFVISKDRATPATVPMVGPFFY